MMSNFNTYMQSTSGPQSEQQLQQRQHQQPHQPVMSKFNTYMQPRSRPHSERDRGEAQAISQSPGSSAAPSTQSRSQGLREQWELHPDLFSASSALFSTGSSTSAEGSTRKNSASSCSSGAKGPVAADIPNQHGRGKEGLAPKKRPERRDSHGSIPNNSSSKMCAKDSNFSSRVFHSFAAKSTDFSNKHGQRKDEFGPSKLRPESEREFDHRRGHFGVRGKGFMTRTSVTTHQSHRQKCYGLSSRPQSTEVYPRGDRHKRLEKDSHGDSPCHFGNHSFGKQSSRGEQGRQDVEDNTNREEEIPPQQMDEDKGEGDSRRKQRWEKAKGEKGQRQETIQHGPARCKTTSETHERTKETTDIMNEAIPRNDHHQEAGCEDTNDRKESVPGNEHQQETDYEDTNDVSENVLGNDPHQETPQSTTHKGARPKHTERKPSQPESQRSKTENTPAAIITTLYVRVDDIVRNGGELGDMLKAAGNNDRLEPEAVQYDDLFTYCSLTCESKNAAKRLQESLFKNGSRASPKIDCSFVDYQVKEKHTVEKNKKHEKPHQSVSRQTPKKEGFYNHQGKDEQAQKKEVKKTTSASIITTLYVRVDDIVKNGGELGDMLKAAGNNDRLEPEAVQYDDHFTYCSLTCESKNAAKRLQDSLFKNGSRTSPKIDCSFVDYQVKEKHTVEKNKKHEEPHQSVSRQTQNPKEGKDEQAQKKEVDDDQRKEQPTDDVNRESEQGKNQEVKKERLKKEVLSEINIMSESAMVKHQETMDGIEKKMNTSKSKLGEVASRRDTLAEIAALESKMEELLNQQKEFCTAIDGIRTQLAVLLDRDVYEKDVMLLRKQLGVECSRLERALPMYARRQEVVRLIQEHPVSIVLAETGSGKSTQIVQYLLEAGVAQHGQIVCTQPRKVAVTSLSKRVAEELVTNEGDRVGYKAGQRVRASPSTRILYMTDHALLNECLADPDLRAFSCVVVDEAHERNLFTDLLLTMIKRCLRRRPDLKVIITSATIDPQVFVDFFGSCPILRVSGRAFPVDVEWEDSASEESEFEKYVDAAVNKVIEIHSREGPGDVLVFLTSAAEIQKCCDLTKQRLKNRTDFQCLPLHGQLQSEDQQKVFAPLERNVRKIVYATNCAETSITINGIKYVVDTGVAKDMVYDAKKQVNSLLVTTISQSSAEQRKGRAGRTAPGKCYRLYSKRSYQSMDKVSLPEILKTHLGHALLKLAQLGVTPDMYDFVQSPSQDSIEAALRTLHQLGALDEEDAITDTGRWIARLPFDPKLGLMTLYGRQCGLLYDTVVLASVMNAGSGLFYRGTSDKDRQNLDKIKLKFSHQGGDALSSLEVYKAWEAEGERKKNAWCMANSINGKAVRGVRETVHDILKILRKEACVEVDEKFSDAQDAADKLRKMVFQCNVSNLCHYLGKEKAGYFAAQARRQVHFHPSSAMCALADFPQWVVYGQLLKTSRDFITGISPVDEAWLQDLSPQLYGFDVEHVRQKKLDVAFTQPAGRHAFFEMVGPRYTMLRRYEEELSAENSDEVVIVEGNREAGEVKVFSTGSSNAVESLKNKLATVVAEAVTEVQQEVREVPIGAEDSGLRVLLGAGGQLTDILLPEETRKVLVTNASEDLTPQHVREKFEEFGDVCYIHQFPSGRNWGFLVYRTPAEAALAAEITKDDDNNVGELERRRAVKHQAEFKARLSWCRRPCTGVGYVDISPAYMAPFLQLGSVWVENQLITIKSNKKRPDDSLYLQGFPTEASEEAVKHSLLHAKGYASNQDDGIIKKIVVVRKKVDATDQKELKKLQERLKGNFQRRLTASTVEVSLWPPKEQSARFTGEARFTDPMEGFEACKELKGRVEMEHGVLDIQPAISATLFVPHLVYKACQQELNTLAADNLQDVKMEVRQKKGSQNYELCLKADDMESLVQARTFINEVIRGDVLDCTASPDLQHLLTPAGRKMITAAEAETSAYVCFDNRTQTLAIHGSTKACTLMKLELNQYLGRLVSGTVEEVELKGSGRPPGLLNRLVQTYGEDMDGLRTDTDLVDITIHYRWHKLKLTGPPESIAKAKALIEEHNQTLAKTHHKIVDDDDDGNVNCVACFCPVELKELYRLEACAHPYCQDCFQRQVALAVKEHQLPVLCCGDGCKAPLSLRDFTSLVRQKRLTLPDLASSALSAYVLANRDKVIFCPTPNCPGVCRRTAEEHARTFRCGECGAGVCTGCGGQVHQGVSCGMARSARRAKTGVESWVEGDRMTRRACPGCASPIEKIGGCNRMTCDACRTIFCWPCGRKFSSSEECYRHLNEEHNGVFNIDDLLY